MKIEGYTDRNYYEIRSFWILTKEEPNKNTRPEDRFQ